MTNLAFIFEKVAQILNVGATSSRIEKNEIACARARVRV